MNKLIQLIKSVRRFLSFKSSLKKYEKLSSEDIVNFQFEKLANLIRYAWEHVPFYRKLWDENGFNPKDLKKIEDIRRIPIIDRKDIIENLNDLVPSEYDKTLLSLVTTGGTSGMPMKFYINNYIARAKEMAFLNYGYRKYAYLSSIERVAIFRGLRVKESLIKRNCFWRFSYIQRGLVFSPFHLTRSNFYYYITKLRSYKPTVIRAYPSTIVELCLLMKDAKEPPIKSLKKIVCSSENISLWQRELIKEVLGVEVWSLYGHSEKCVIGFQVEETRMFFHPFYGITEFLLPDSRPASKGELAEVVVTGFDHDYFPLIRYRTNDLVEVWKSDSFSEMVASSIVGRNQDFVIDMNGNKIQFTNHDEPFWELEGILAYQYIQQKKGELILRLQTEENYDSMKDQILLQEIKKIFINFEISIIHVDEIEKTERGKFKYLIQYLDVKSNHK